MQSSYYIPATIYSIMFYPIQHVMLVNMGAIVMETVANVLGEMSNATRRLECVLKDVNLLGERTNV